MTTMISDKSVNDLERWKEPGEMTKVTQDIRDLIDSISGEGIEYLKNVCLYLRTYYYVPDFSHRPDRFKRTAHEILCPVDDVKQDEQGKIPIGTCTEWGKVVRTLSIAREIPAVWVETLEKKWIDGKYPEGTYSNHIFLEVFVDNKWYILNPTAHPQDTEQFIREKTESPKYLTRDSDGVMETYRVIATGLDSRSLQAQDGTKLSFRTEKEWEDYVDSLFPRKNGK